MSSTQRVVDRLTRYLKLLFNDWRHLALTSATGTEYRQPKLTITLKAGVAPDEPYLLSLKRPCVLQPTIRYG